MKWQRSDGEANRADRNAIETGIEISAVPAQEVDFLHATLCQVGMPRSRTTERVFERSNGASSMRLEAGSLYVNGQWVEQELPYGTRPRLVMIYLSSVAMLTDSRVIEIGDGIGDFCHRLGMPASGGPRGNITALKAQMTALAACRIQLGIPIVPGLVRTVNTNPIQTFDAWATRSASGQREIWPGRIELSHEYMETLKEFAVPLDPRALGALTGSALSMDIYTWLAHRLRRVGDQPVRLSWANLKDQFGQEYKAMKDFKTSFSNAMKQVLAVYPDARVDPVIGGIMLRQSKAPVVERMGRNANHTILLK